MRRVTRLWDIGSVEVITMTSRRCVIFYRSSTSFQSSLGRPFIRFPSIKIRIWALHFLSPIEGSKKGTILSCKANAHAHPFSPSSCQIGSKPQANMIFWLDPSNVRWVITQGRNEVKTGDNEVITRWQERSDNNEVTTGDNAEWQPSAPLCAIPHCSSVPHPSIHGLRPLCDKLWGYGFD